LLPPPAVIAVVGANEVVVGAGGAVIVGAEEDEEEEEGEEEDGDENGDEGVVVVAPAVVAVFCVKSIVRRTGWHISAAVGVPASIADAHNSKLLTLAGIVTLIGRLIGGACSFP
jgi:precorrin isomerase